MSDTTLVPLDNEMIELLRKALMAQALVSLDRHDRDEEVACDDLYDYLGSFIKEDDDDE